MPISRLSDVRLPDACHAPSTTLDLRLGGEYSIRRKVGESAIEASRADFATRLAEAQLHLSCARSPTIFFGTAGVKRGAEMDHEEGTHTVQVLRRALTVRNGLLLVTFTVIVSLVSVGIAEAITAVLGSRAQNLGTTGQVFDSMAAVFSGLAFIALVVTFLLQLEELRMQRRELESQRAEMTRTQGELHRTAEADLRRLHVDLIKMAIDDPELADVWSEPGPEVPLRVRRQYWYANLILQHQRLAMELNNTSVEEARTWMRAFFRSPIMREFWGASAEARRRIVVPGTPEWDFAQITDEVYRELTEPPEPSDPGVQAT